MEVFYVQEIKFPFVFTLLMIFNFNCNISSWPNGRGALDTLLCRSIRIVIASILKGTSLTKVQFYVN